MAIFDFITSAYVVFSMSLIVVYIGLAVLLHLQFGVAGIVNFGVVGFWGIGMYSFGILLLTYDIPYLLALAMATLLTAFIAFVLGYIILDLDNQSVLVATLAFAVIVKHLITTEKWLTKGVVGFGTVPFPFDGKDADIYFFLIMLAIVFALMFYAHKLQQSPYGRLLHSIRDNELLAQSLGKPVLNHKLILFSVTSGLMGFFGALYASFAHFLEVDILGPGVTFTVWIALILGGKRHIWGGFLGVMVTVFLFNVVFENYLFGELVDQNIISRAQVWRVPNIKLMIYGLALLLTLMYRPLGILGKKN